MSNEGILRACRVFALPNREILVSTDLREAFTKIDGHDTSRNVHTESWGDPFLLALKDGMKRSRKCFLR